MKNISLSLICLFAFGFAGAQDISFTFTAHYHSEYAPLDSVLVENLSQGGDTTLYWPDTVLSLFSNIDRDYSTSNQILLSQNYPNPFQGSTEAILYVPGNEKVSLELYDIYGHKLADYRDELEPGNHVFSIHTDRTGTSNLIARTENTTDYILLINTDPKSGKNTNIRYKGNHRDNETKILQKKQIATERSSFVYSNGDYLGFTGYVQGASKYISDFPDKDSTYLMNILPTFDFVIETTDDNMVYSFEVGGADDFEVIWEPGQSEIYNTSGDLSHDFGESGLWRIKVRGNVDYIMFDENAEMFRDVLTPVKPGVYGLTLSSNMFRNITVSAFSCKNFFDEASAGITDMSFMFAGSAFNQDINNWNLSNTTDVRGIFSYSDFNQPLSAWDMHNIEVFAMMFMGSSFNQDISGWDVSGANDMSDMFSYSVFNQDIAEWDVSNVTNMASMFSHSVFNQDISNWDVSGVTNMGSMDYNSRGMFQNSAFDQDISEWDVSNVNNFHYFLKDAALSTEHYNNLLIQWSELDLQPDVYFYGGNSMYDLGLPAVKRQYIIDEFGWTITDGGDTGEQY